ncbi:anhydro-N-acetylmuramic acid kinase [Solitalea longa]|uniref:Anhydro-N-acetylmuramic acid kinase n=1 Tax=Solitalea longa TaxID=2079460 RepID=A0A2S5A353_9SPHI|nr:anhydro-N-acetylmuramic acid kinase [Solitalea longa]POY37010.1 anhydro-N-acetylmuramic acid kinase [Solitalea longa]
MKQQIARLNAISNKSERLIVGLMSGTSMDGLDIALCSVKGAGPSTGVKIIQFETIPFDEKFKLEIRKIFAKEEVKFEQLCVLNPFIATIHAKLINDCLKKWGFETQSIDLIASHGQTVFHAPKRLHRNEKFGNATLQIGDGDHLAVNTGIITISDFRQKHIAAGGEGAPLAVYGDYLIFSEKGEDRIMLNIGGIANFTYLPADLDPTKVFSTDVGTGNTLIDAYIHKFYPGMAYDEDGKIARSGKMNEALLSVLKEHSFFKEAFPKSTGPELFNSNYVDEVLKKVGKKDISPEDLIRTLTRFSADGIVEAIKSCFSKGIKLHVYGSGGGIHNPCMMEDIKSQLPECVFHTTEELGIIPDAKEAVLFAVLANELVAGEESELFGNEEKGTPKVTMGKISLP